MPMGDMDTETEAAQRRVTSLEAVLDTRGTGASRGDLARNGCGMPPIGAPTQSGGEHLVAHCSFPPHPGELEVA